jgi:hypothetical protein
MATPAEPEPAEPALQTQIPAGPMPWQELTPAGEVPAWRKNALAILYALAPELAPPLPYVTPDASPLPERTEAELAAERATSQELASAALQRIAPDQAAPAQAVPVQAAPTPQAALPEKSPSPAVAQAPAAPGAAAPAQVPAPIPAPQATPRTAAPPAQAAAAKASPGPEGAAPQAAPGLIYSIDLECDPGQCTLRIETKQPVERVSQFQKVQPARLAVDLSGSWIYHGPTTLPGNEDFVERIRLGVHPDRFRVVLDYKGDQDVPRHEPIIEKRGNTLLVKITK